MNKISIVNIIFILISCGKTDQAKQDSKSIRFLSFDKFLDSPVPAKKNMEIFAGNAIQGAVISLGKRPQVYTALPADEAFIYAVREITLVELEQGTNELKPGEALFLPAKTVFRLSSKYEKTESKVILVRSNKGNVDLLNLKEK